MKTYNKSSLNRAGKILAKPLSHLLANSVTEGITQMVEAYSGILLGKGAGSGWALTAEAKAAQSVIRHPRPVVFDVGANRGEWSLLLNKKYPHAQIFLFEPQPEFQNIIAERRIAHFRLIPKAASENSGETVTLYTSEGVSGAASLHRRKDSYLKGREFTSIDVETIAIDDVVQEFNIERVDFMKMDIEGHEFNALKGAIKSLEGGVIKALSFEFGSCNVNSRTYFRDYWDFLIPLRYKLYRILPSSRLMAIKDYYEDCEYFRGATNYVAMLSDLPRADRA